MRKILAILFISGLLLSGDVYADDNYTTTSAFEQTSITPFKTGTDSYRQFSDEIRLERAVVSNALQLSEEQAKDRYKIFEDNFAVIDEKFLALYYEELKLRELTTQNADKNTIKLQQRKVKTLKKEIKKIVKEENKQYKKILTSEQCAKLREIQRLQRQTFEKNSKQKDYYKLNPKMRPFAPHLAQ